jgi:hypothetical protein
MTSKNPGPGPFVYEGWIIFLSFVLVVLLSVGAAILIPKLLEAMR